MSKVSLFVVGAAKCGTTSLYDYLVKNNIVNELIDKEPHYFGEHSVFGEKKIYSLLKYHENIIPGDGIFSDFSTSYLYSKSAAEEIYSYNPDAKIVIVLRHPFERAVSLYNHQRRSMRESCSFEDALNQEYSRVAKGFPYGFHYMTSGLYYDQVKRYLDVFGENNVLVIRFSSLIDNSFVGQISDFLNVSIPSDKYIARENKTGIPRSYFLQRVLEESFPLKNLVRKILGRNLIKKIRALNTGEKQSIEMTSEHLEYFKEDLDKLYRLLGWGKGEWL